MSTTIKNLPKETYDRMVKSLETYPIEGDEESIIVNVPLKIIIGKDYIRLQEPLMGDLINKDKLGLWFYSP